MYDPRDYLSGANYKLAITDLLLFVWGTYYKDKKDALKFRCCLLVVATKTILANVQRLFSKVRMPERAFLSLDLFQNLVTPVPDEIIIVCRVLLRTLLYYDQVPTIP